MTENPSQDTRRRPNKRRLGTSQEEAAAEYLRREGFTILAHSYRCRAGEIDLIARDRDGTLVFAEVKYRRDRAVYDPLEAVDIKKQRRISRAALWYYRDRRLSPDQPCRFDVIGIGGDGEILHVRDAFPFRP